MSHSGLQDWSLCEILCELLIWPLSVTEATVQSCQVEVSRRTIRVNCLQLLKLLNASALRPRIIHTGMPKESPILAEPMDQQPPAVITLTLTSSCQTEMVFSGRGISMPASPGFSHADRTGLLRFLGSPSHTSAMLKDLRPDRADLAMGSPRCCSHTPALPVLCLGSKSCNVDSTSKSKSKGSGIKQLYSKSAANSSLWTWRGCRILGVDIVQLFNSSLTNR